MITIQGTKYYTMMQIVETDNKLLSDGIQYYLKIK